MSEKPIKPLRQAGQGEVESRRFRFGLSDLLVLMFVIGFVLAMTTQLGGIGFFVSAFLSMAAAGCWFSRRKMLMGGVVGFLVFVITYAAAYVQVGYDMAMHRDTWDAHLYVDRTRSIIDKYREQKGRLPDTAAELASLAPELNVDERDTVVSYYDVFMQYERTGDSYKLIALGRDGKVGGVGIDSDREWQDPSSELASRLPIKQFLYETRGSHGLFLAAAVTSFIACSMGFSVSPAGTSSRKTVLLLVVGIIAGSSIVGPFLAIFHIAASQSSH